MNSLRPLYKSSLNNIIAYNCINANDYYNCVNELINNSEKDNSDNSNVNEYFVNNNNLNINKYFRNYKYNSIILIILLLSFLLLFLYNR